MPHEGIEALIGKRASGARRYPGRQLLEAAIITPLLLLLTFSIVDFAALFYVYLALENGVSQATRFAVTGHTSGDRRTRGASRSRRRCATRRRR